MAASAINASATAANTSGDIDIAAGDSVTLSLFVAVGQAIPEGCSASVQIKSSNGAYFQVDVLDHKKPALIVDGPGVYRVVKKKGELAFGVDQS
jgi:hypothetical protein